MHVGWCSAKNGLLTYLLAAPRHILTSLMGSAGSRGQVMPTSRRRDPTVTAALIAAVTTIIAAVGAGALALANSPSKGSGRPNSSASQSSFHFTTTDVVVIVVVVCLLAVAAASYGVVFYRSRAKAVEVAQEQERREREEVEKILERLRDRMALPSLVELNRLTLTQYHSIATNQAQKSFKSAQRAMLAGFTWLIACFAAAIVINSLDGKLITAGLAPIGGILAGFLGRTYLAVYERSLVQLNQYYNQPLLNSYYLAAERLISDSKDLSTTARDSLLEGVVRQLLTTADSLTRSAENNSSGNLRFKNNWRPVLGRNTNENGSREPAANVSDA